MDHDAIFTKRAASYTYAVKQYPDTLKDEFRVAVDMCAPLVAGDLLVSIPGACVELEPWIPSGVEYLPLETSAELAERNRVATAKLDAIPLKDRQASHVLSLASLHHATPAERAAFYAEAWRILRPGGRLLIGDVDAESPQAAWLNTFVHRHNSLGHCGLFWKEADAERIAQAGFAVKTCLRDYEWRSASAAAELDFTRHLFGLDLATDAEIGAGLDTYFPGRPPATIPWSLRYFVAIKPTENQTFSLRQ